MQLTQYHQMGFLKIKNQGCLFMVKSEKHKFSSRRANLNVSMLAFGGCYNA